MADEKTNKEEIAVKTTQEDEKNTEKTVPLAALHEERDKRRSLEAKLQEFEDREKKKEEEELTFKQKFEKRDQEYKDLVKNNAIADLRNKATIRLLDEGLPKKIVTPILASAELTEDNLDKTIKDILKDYGEFKTKPEEKKTNSSLLHPTTSAEEQIRSHQEMFTRASNEIFNKAH